MAEIEYFYAAHSAFAYLGSARFMEIANTAGRKIVHKPYDIRKALVAIGSTLTKERPAAHRAYFFGREIQRWSEHRNAPVMTGRPTYHDNDIALPNCILIAAQTHGDNVDALAHAMLQAHWRDDADLADRDTLATLMKNLEIDPEKLFEAASSKTVRDEYAANTGDAIKRSVFGSPTYFVDGDMFYGQDHLEMVERALKQPYRGTWPPAS